MDQINFTQLAGLIGFGLAALLCARAAWSQRQARSLWVALSIIYLMMFADVLIQLRHLIRVEIVDVLKVLGVYGDRQSAQTALLIGLGVIAAFFSLRLLIRMRGLAMSAQLAFVGTVFVFALYVLELISLHAIDAILYRPIGPVLLIGWLWMAGSGTSAAAAKAVVKKRS
jgi:hypothetical protein